MNSSASGWGNTGNHRAKVAMAVITELQGMISTGGRKFTRDEMNQRR